MHIKRINKKVLTDATGVFNFTFSNFITTMFSDKMIHENLEDKNSRIINYNLYDLHELKEAQEFVIAEEIFQEAHNTSIKKIPTYDFKKISTRIEDLQGLIKLECSINLPFKKCYFRLDRNFIMTSADRGLDYVENRDLFIGGIYIEELGFDKFKVLFLSSIASVEEGKEDGYFFGISTWVDETAHNIFYLNIIKIILDRLHNQPIATYSAPSIRIPQNTGFSNFKPNSIIYIGSKKQYEKRVQINNQKTEWLYRWKRRGHWRRFLKEGGLEIDIERIGRDRNGDRVIKGMTWVIECEVGPSDKELKEQMRVIL